MVITSLMPKDVVQPEHVNVVKVYVDKDRSMIGLTIARWQSVMEPKLFTAA